MAYKRINVSLSKEEHQALEEIILSLGGTRAGVLRDLFSSAMPELLKVARLHSQLHALKGSARDKFLLDLKEREDKLVSLLDDALQPALFVDDTQGAS